MTDCGFHPLMRGRLAAVLALYSVVSAYDLSAPPISQTLWRQTQTAELTRNFVSSGFDWDGLCIYTHGKTPVIVHYDFPIFNVMAGLFDNAFGHSPFTGKAIAFVFGGVAAVAVYWLAASLLSGRLDDAAASSAAATAAILFVTCPISGLMNTGYQPDSMALALTLAGSLCLAKVPANGIPGLVTAASLLTAATLIKLPIVIPYLPMLGAMAWHAAHRCPRLILPAVVMFAICLMPVAWWYFLREVPGFGLMSEEQLTAMFRVGDLSRFTRAGFYLKPAIATSILVLGGVGVAFFFVGCAWQPGVAAAVVLGVVLYYVLIPTVADQYYYLYPVVPLFGVVVALGCERARRVASWERASIRALAIGTVSIWLLVLFAGWAYVLRQDRVILAAAQDLKARVGLDETVLFLPAHDRVVGRGSFNPAFFYFAQAKGWVGDTTRLRTAGALEREVADLDVQWIVATRYTPDLETMFGQLLPRGYRNEPYDDSAELWASLKRHYSLVSEQPNWVIFRVLDRRSGPASSQLHQQTASETATAWHGEGAK